MKTTQKIPKTFFIFLATSFLIWLLITFSKEYETHVQLPLVYQNIPQNKLLQQEPNHSIDLKIKASGFKILRTKIRKKSIFLDAAKLQRKEYSKFYLLMKNQSRKIESQLIGGVKLLAIEQDSLFLSIGVLSSKKVPLKPNITIDYNVGYDLLDEIKILPDSVLISGPEMQLKNIQHLNLSEVNLKDVKSNFNEKVSILKPEDISNLKLEVDKATIIGNVDKFTEGTLEIPFTVKNMSQDTKLITLTENIQVVFTVALSNFAKVTASSFKIECDFEMAVNNNLTYLIPKITAQPDFVRNTKVVPSKIDFLIQK